MDSIKAAGVVVALLVSIVGLWTALGLPKPALSEDLDKLENSQLEYAIPLLEDQLDRLILRKALLESQGVAAHNRELQALGRQIDRATDRASRARARSIQLQTR